MAVRPTSFKGNRNPAGLLLLTCVSVVRAPSAIAALAPFSTSASDADNTGGSRPGYATDISLQESP